MKKRRSFFADPIAIVVTVLGLVLMAVWLHYNKYWPVCGGARQLERELHPVSYWVHFPIILFMMLVEIVTDLEMPGWVSLTVLLVCPTIVIFACGKVLSLVVRLIRSRKERKSLT